MMINYQNALFNLFLRVLEKLIHPLRIQRRGAALQAMHEVPLLKQEPDQIGAVLTGNAGYQCCFAHRSNLVAIIPNSHLMVVLLHINQPS